MAMAFERRGTGIDAVGDMVSWGGHFCLFYETKSDLIDALVSYCKLGLERKEYCLWVVAEPLTIEGAKEALQEAVPDLDRYFAESRIEIITSRDLFLQGGTFDSKRVAATVNEKLASISAKGYPGMRVTGDTSWLTNKDWAHFCELEHDINEAVGDQRLSVLCTYPLSACGPLEILDTVRTHQFAIARRYGSWDIIETATLKRAKAEIARLNEELEQRVAERTSQLMQASEALREAQTALAHANRVTTMGQLAASITHEIKQPITAAVASAQAAFNWLGTRPPNLEEVRQALSRVVEAGTQANEFSDRIRNLFRKAPVRKVRFEVNDAIREVITLTHGEVTKNKVALQTELGDGLPLVQGDRVQLQQVVLNLVINAVEAMTGISDGPRQLLIRTEKDASSGVLVAVQDSGPGVSSDSLDDLFKAFYTTKPDGMGMGLSICQSIVEAHGGRLWAAPNGGPGATFLFTVPTGGGGS
jgi:C4-dicarboxylate-specific signal transduction histidine kinase